MFLNPLLIAFILNGRQIRSQLLLSYLGELLHTDFFKTLYPIRNSVDKMFHKCFNCILYILHFSHYSPVKSSTVKYAGSLYPCTIGSETERVHTGLEYCITKLNDPIVYFDILILYLFLSICFGDK